MRGAPGAGYTTNWAEVAMNSWKFTRPVLEAQLEANETRAREVQDQKDLLYGQLRKLCSKSYQIAKTGRKIKKKIRDYPRRLYFSTEAAGVTPPFLPIEIMKIIFSYLAKGSVPYLERQLYRFYPVATQALMDVTGLNNALRHHRSKWLLRLFRQALSWNSINAERNARDPHPAWTSYPHLGESLGGVLRRVGPLVLPSPAIEITLFNEHLLTVRCPPGVYQQITVDRDVHLIELFDSTAPQRSKELPDGFCVPYNTDLFTWCDHNSVAVCARCKPVFLINSRSRALRVCSQ